MEQYEWIQLKQEFFVKQMLDSSQLEFILRNVITDGIFSYC